MLPRHEAMPPLRVAAAEQPFATTSIHATYVVLQDNIATSRMNNIECIHEYLP